MCKKFFFSFVLFDIFFCLFFGRDRVCCSVVIPVMLMRIWIRLSAWCGSGFYLMRMRIPLFTLKTLEKVLRYSHIPYIWASRLQKLMRILFRSNLSLWCWSGSGSGSQFLFDADADTDPQRWSVGIVGHPFGFIVQFWEMSGFEPRGLIPPSYV